jgi:hypothetical protein
VRLMKLREGDEVSAVALVVESEAAAGDGTNGATPVLEAGGETVAVDEALAEGDDDGIVAIDPADSADGADGAEPEETEEPEDA